jgi:DNA repair protein RadC
MYKPIPERTILADAPPEKRSRARQACASTRANYEWLDVDVCLTRRSDVKPKLPAIQGARAASAFFHEIYPVGRLAQEVFFVLCLNARLVPVGLAVPHKGGLSGSMVEIKTIFKPAILLPTAGIIYAHNHPSGDTTPSMEDTELTARLKEAGSLLGIKFYDHLILTEDPARYYSFTEGQGR